MAVALLALGCSAGEAASPSRSVALCRPTPFEQDPLTWGEVRAVPEPGLDAWALVFATYDPGDELRIPVEHELKIVWRVGSAGEVLLAASGPDGITIEPVWGPEAHLGSNWERPGDEFGTGWVFPTEGCWKLQLERGGDRATLTALVEAQAAFDLG